MARVANADQVQVAIGGTAAVERKCSGCGCTDDEACFDEARGPCWWVKAELCSHCEISPQQFVERTAVLEAVRAIGTPCLASQIEQLVEFNTFAAISDLTRDDSALTFVYPESKPGDTGRQFIDYRFKGPRA